MDPPHTSLAFILKKLKKKSTPPIGLRIELRSNCCTHANGANGGL